MPAVYGISIMLINVRVGLGWACSNDERHAVTPLPTGSRDRRRNFSIYHERKGVYVSTEVYAEPFGHSCNQLSGASEPGDGSAASSVTAIIPGYSRDSKVIHDTV